MKISAGVKVGPYEVIEQVGRGGMATVFKAYQAALERMVAIKVLPEFLAEDDQFRERFRREAVAIAKLRHPGILAVYDHGEFDGQPYIVTEFVEGGTFADELGRPIAISRALAVLSTVASALDYAHERGVLHRDVKPSNILVAKDGAAVLGDFGLARMMASNERLTRLDTVVGTPEYMSPEQCAGRETGAASDQYALGIVAFEALTGRVPYNAETPAAVMLAQMQSPVPDPRGVNPSLSTAIDLALERALSKEPADRYPTCTAFVKALEAAVPGAGAGATVKAPAAVPAPKPVAAATPAAAPSPAGRLPTRALVAGAVALIVLVGLAGIALALSSNRHPSTNVASTTPSPSGPQHGSLIYQMKPAQAAWPGGEAPTPAPPGSITFGYSSSLDLTIKKDTDMWSVFDAPALKNYVADIVMKVDPGSDFEINWLVRDQAAGEKAQVYLNIQVSQEAMTLLLSPNSGSNQALAATASLAGFQNGRTIDLAVVVNEQSIVLYVDAKKIIDVTETAATGATTPSFDINGRSGALHILSLRYYAVS